MRLRLLGSPRLEGDDGTALPLNRLDAALLALLAVDGPTSRARCIALLWPELPEADARNRLRQRLFRLRRSAGTEVVAGDELLSLAPAVAGDPGDTGPGELLGDDAHDERPAFAEWLAASRARGRALRRERFAAEAERLEREERIAEALVVAERLAADEPLLEAAHRRLMRLHYRRGDRGAALAVHARLVAALDTALGEAPSAETTVLAAQIERSGALPVAPAPLRPMLVLRPPRLVGRDAEWQRLRAAADRGAPILLTGEPGIGKTRLAGDFAAAQGWPLVPCRPGDAAVPFSLLARLLRAAPPAAAIEPWARSALARLLPEWGAAADGRPDPLRLGAAAAQALAAAPGLALDDLQFADEASLALLPTLVQAGRGPRWLLVARSAELPAVLAAWQAALEPGVLESVALAPLDLAAVQALLASLELPGFDAAAWAPRVHRHSGGNPVFILETLRAVLGAGESAGDRLPLPPTLRHLLDARFAQLSPAAQKLARVAAVAGADFGVELAAAVLDAHPLDLADAWAELESAQLMRAAGFVHDLVHEAIRASVPEALARWLHARVADALGATAPPTRVAEHRQAAGDWAAAAAAWSAAADAARDAGRAAEELRLLERAAEAHHRAGDAKARFAALERRAGAAIEALGVAGARPMADALLAVAADDRERGLALKQVAGCELHAARFDPAREALEGAIAASSAAGDTHNANHCRYLLALAEAQTRGVPEALARLETLVPWAESQPDAVLRHAFLADLAILCDQADQRRRARPLFERALAHFDATHDSANAASTRMMYARNLLMQGALHAACAQLEAAVRARDELSEGAGGMGIEALNLARAYCELGRYAALIALVEPLRERLADPGAAVVRAAATLVLARTFAHLGQPARALVLCDEVGDAGPFHQRAGAAWVRSLLEIDRPRSRAARLDEALGAFAAVDLPFVRLPIAFDRLACDAALGEELGAAITRGRALVAECETRELFAPQLLGRLRLVQLLGAAGEHDAALVVAHALASDLADDNLPVGLYLPELHAVLAGAGRAGGDAAFAREQLAAGLAWIERAQAGLPAPFADSFRRRNPVNRALLAAAGAL